jgi:phosphatidylglycerophosphate synthase
VAQLDALVIATELSHVRIAGLEARERASRVATQVGATRVHVVENLGSVEELVSWRDGRTCPLLVISADQLVHTPLVAPLIKALPTLGRDGIAIATVPDEPIVQDLTPGSYAGALLATGSAADEVIANLSDGDSALVARLAAPLRVPHGQIARAPIATPEQRRQAHRVLYRILVKPQDNAITRYLYRPVSFPLTRLLVWTPITPNQISYVVAALVAIGCWLTAHQSMHSALLGTIVVLAASYVDCCDGEVARVKLLSSRFGAWIDTVVDELSSVGYMVALGWHCHLYFGPSYFHTPLDPWKIAIAISVVTYLWTIYCVYYNIIVAVGSANSQDYVGRFEVVPGRSPNTVRLAPAAAKAIATKEPLPPWLDFLATYAPYLVRRDFISWGAVLLVALHLTHLAFALFAIGGVITAVIVTVDHLKLRSLRRSIERRGQLLDAP